MIKLENIEILRGNKQIFTNYNQSFTSPGLNLITGKNGSGKTTLIKMMAGFIIPNKGTIKCQFNSSYEWLQNHIYIGSQNSLSNELSIEENIKMWLGIRGWIFSKSEIDTCLRNINIFNYKNLLISQCSDGIKRKTDICKLFFSFKSKIKFWLLDEPTNNLDEEGKKAFLSLIRTFLNANGTSIMSSHDNNSFYHKINKINLI